MRIQGNACLHPGIVNLLNSSVQVRTGFGMNRQNIGTTLLKGLYVTLWLDYHQMHVHDFFAVLSHRLYHWHSVGYIRDKNAIHNIDMEPVCLASINHFTVALEVAKVGS